MSYDKLNAIVTANMVPGTAYSALSLNRALAFELVAAGMSERSLSGHIRVYSDKVPGYPIVFAGNTTSSTMTYTGDPFPTYTPGIVVPRVGDVQALRPGATVASLPALAALTAVTFGAIPDCDPVSAGYTAADSGTVRRLHTEIVTLRTRLATTETAYTSAINDAAVNANKARTVANNPALIAAAANPVLAAAMYELMYNAGACDAEVAAAHGAPSALAALAAPATPAEPVADPGEPAPGTIQAAVQAAKGGKGK